MYPVLLARLFDTVYTFEPNDINWRALKYNVDQHSTGNINAFFAGLGAYPATCSCDTSTTGNAGESKVKLGAGNIEITTIDSLDLPGCDLIMLDVEGFELQAIMGAQRTIAQYQPVVIAEGPERNNDTVTAVMEQLGYELVDMVGTANDAVYIHTGSLAPTRSGGLPFVPPQKVKKKKILIAIPTAKNIEVETFKSIYDLEVPAGYETTFQYFYGYRIDQIRNLIADWMVNNDFDYLFSVDSDIAFPPDTLTRFLEHDRDMVTGVYRQRKPEQIVEIYNGVGQNISWESLKQAGEDQKLVEVGGCGFGCVLIKKQVFTAIPYPHFEYTVALNHANTISEDVDFCRKATNRGFTIWCDTHLQCDHIGSTVYRVS